MPKNKDLKRLVRARMAKTGESYTAALRHLLAKEQDGFDYPSVAGMSDAAISRSTGRTWREWTTWLDRKNASQLAHPDIVRLVTGGGGDFSGWWAQSITVGYERIKGLREIGQQRSGTYNVNKSKTVGVPIERLYRYVAQTRYRNRWLPNVDWIAGKSVKNKSLRISWQDGSALDFSFREKSEHKSVVTLQHRKIKSKARAAELKKFWTERLDALADLLS